MHKNVLEYTILKQNNSIFFGGGGEGLTLRPFNTLNLKMTLCRFESTPLPTPPPDSKNPGYAYGSVRTSLYNTVNVRKEYLVVILK